MTLRPGSLTFKSTNPGSDRWVLGPKLPVSLAYGAFVATDAGLEIFGGSEVIQRTGRHGDWMPPKRVGSKQVRSLWTRCWAGPLM